MGTGTSICTSQNGEVIEGTHVNATKLFASERTTRVGHVKLAIRCGEYLCRVPYGGCGLQ